MPAILSVLIGELHRNACHWFGARRYDSQIHRCVALIREASQRGAAKQTIGVRSRTVVTDDDKIGLELEATACPTAPWVRGCSFDFDQTNQLQRCEIDIGCPDDSSLIRHDNDDQWRCHEFESRWAEGL